MFENQVLCFCCDEDLLAYDSEFEALPLVYSSAERDNYCTWSERVLSCLHLYVALRALNEVD